MMLLAETLAVVAVNPGTGRHGLGVRSQMNACLAGLLVADLVFDGSAEVDGAESMVRLTGKAPDNHILIGVARVVAGKGPKIKSVLSGMDRGLVKHLGAGTWNVAVMAAAGDPTAAAQLRDVIVADLQRAVSSGGPVDQRTALVLSMTGPANLLEVIAPQRGDARKHARNRIDHVTDGTPLECLPRIVRKLIAEAAAAAAAGASTAVS